MSTSLKISSGKTVSTFRITSMEVSKELEMNHPDFMRSCRRSLKYCPESITRSHVALSERPSRRGMVPIYEFTEMGLLAVLTNLPTQEVKEKMVLLVDRLYRKTQNAYLEKVKTTKGNRIWGYIPKEVGGVDMGLYSRVKRANHCDMDLDAGEINALHKMIGGMYKKNIYVGFASL